MAKTCKSCGGLGDDPCKFCNPTVEVLTCSICGETDVGETHVCRKKPAAKQYSCRACGNVSEDASDLCKPYEVP